MMQHVHICGQQRETLIHNLPPAAEAAYLAVPAQSGKAAILHEGGSLCMGSSHVLQMMQRDIADAEKACASGIAFLAHRLPDFSIELGPSFTRCWPVQHITIDVVRPQMLQRASHGLRHLHCKTG